MKCKETMIQGIHLPHPVLGPIFILLQRDNEPLLQPLALSIVHIPRDKYRALGRLNEM
jgi:hypothetical protein